LVAQLFIIYDSSFWKSMKNLENISMRDCRLIPALVLIFDTFSLNFGQGSIEVSTSQGKQETLTTTSNSKDAEFLSRAAEINREEISLGQLAEKKSSLKEVKNLGKMLEHAHAKSQKDLDALAKIKMIAVPKEETFDIQHAYLKSKAEFDKSVLRCDGR